MSARANTPSGCDPVHGCNCITPCLQCKCAKNDRYLRREIKLIARVSAALANFAKRQGGT